MPGHIHILSVVRYQFVLCTMSFKLTVMHFTRDCFNTSIIYPTKHLKNVPVSLIPSQTSNNVMKSSNLTDRDLKMTTNKIKYKLKSVTLNRSDLAV